MGFRVSRLIQLFPYSDISDQLRTRTRTDDNRRVLPTLCLQLFVSIRQLQLYGAFLFSFSSRLYILRVCTLSLDANDRLVSDGRVCPRLHLDSSCRDVMEGNAGDATLTGKLLRMRRRSRLHIMAKSILPGLWIEG